jgi:hypothetical protein
MHSPCAARRTAYLLCLILLIGTPACSRLAEAPDTGPGAPEITFEAEIAFGDGPFDFPDPRAGLADLSSYSATLTVQFEGTRDANPEAWSRTYTMSATREPHARQWSIEQSGDLPTTGTVVRAEMNGLVYEKRGEAACLAEAINAADPLTERLELAGLLSGVIGAQPAGTERLNEIESDHYTFDERALGEGANSKSEGELWVAQAGAYLIRYRLTTRAGPDYFGEGVEGVLHLDYQLTDPGAPLTITLPDDCPPGLVDLPHLPGAENIQDSPGVSSYEVPYPVAETADLLEQALAPLGWTSQADPGVTDTTGVLTYVMGERALIITIEATDSGSSVTVFMGTYSDLFK